MNKRTYFTLNLILMASIMFVLSFIPENFPELFGDYVCKPRVHHSGFFSPLSHSTSTETHWGFRHYVWCWAGTIALCGNLIFLTDKMNEWGKSDKKPTSY